MVHQSFLGNFYGVDCLMDLLILFVASLVAYQSKKVYSIVKDKNYLLFSWSFLSIAIAFFFKIISNFTASYRIVIDDPNLIRFVMQELAELYFVYFISAMLYKIFLLVGFLVLFLIVTKTDSKSKAVLFVYLGLMTILFSVYFDFVFHLTILIILIFLTSYFHENYLKLKTRSSYLVFVAFVIMLFGNIAFMLESYSPWIYLIGESLLLMGFLILLSNHLEIRKLYKYIFLRTWKYLKYSADFFASRPTPSNSGFGQINQRVIKSNEKIKNEKKNKTGSNKRSA